MSGTFMSIYVACLNEPSYFLTMVYGIIENTFSYLIIAYFNWLLSSADKEYIILKVSPTRKQQSI